MRWTLLLYWMGLGLVFAKTIEDPVPRHDVSMCAVFLCPSVVSNVKEYLVSGCDGTLKEFLRGRTNTKNDVVDRGENRRAAP